MVKNDDINQSPIADFSCLNRLLVGDPASKSNQIRVLGNSVRLELFNTSGKRKAPKDNRFLGWALKSKEEAGR